MHSGYVIDVYIQNNFKVLLSSLQFFVRHACVSKFTFKIFAFFKKSKLSVFSNVNLLFMCKQFFLPWGYLYSELIFLILFFLMFMGASFLIALFIKRFALLEYSLYKGVSLLDSSHIFQQEFYIERTLFGSRKAFCITLIMFCWLLGIKKM